MSATWEQVSGKTIVKMTVFGEPVPQGRPRFSTINGHVQAIDPKKSKDYKQLIQLEAQPLFYKGFKTLETACILRVHVFRGIPKSWSKKKKEAALGNILRPTSRPDADNYLKCVSDALNSLIIKDDSYFVDNDVRKFYSDRPRIEIEVEEISDEMDSTAR